MTPATQRLNPVLNNLSVVKPLWRHPTSEVHHPIIHQAAETDCSSFFST